MVSCPGVSKPVRLLLALIGCLIFGAMIIRLIHLVEEVATGESIMTPNPAYLTTRVETM
jgi:hypothetical protein